MSIQAGLLLDVLVAEKVMGWSATTIRTYPRYSADLAAAWEVVEHLRTQGYWLKLVTDWRGEPNGCAAAFPPLNFTPFPSEYHEADTPAHAICLAALAALTPAPEAQR